MQDPYAPEIVNELQYRFAVGVHRDQRAIARIFRRGWAGQFIRYDNSARKWLELMEHPLAGPVSDYINAVNGDKSVFEERLLRLGQCFGTRVLDTVVEDVAFDTSATGIERYVPPVSYTYAMFRMDGESTQSAPFFDDTKQQLATMFDRTLGSRDT